MARELRHRPVPEAWSTPIRSSRNSRTARTEQRECARRAPARPVARRHRRVVLARWSLVRADHAHRHDRPAAAFRRRPKRGRRARQIIAAGLRRRATCTSTCCTAASSCCWASRAAVGVGAAARPRDGLRAARSEALVNPAFLLIRPIPPLAWIPLADRLARPGRRGEGADHLARRVRAVGDQQLRAACAHRSVRCSKRRARSASAARCSCARCCFPARAPMIFTGSAAVAAGVLDDAGRGRADRRDRGARPRALPERRSTSSRR